MININWGRADWRIYEDVLNILVCKENFQDSKSRSISRQNFPQLLNLLDTESDTFSLGKILYHLLSDICKKFSCSLRVGDLSLGRLVRGQDFPSLVQNNHLVFRQQKF